MRNTLLILSIFLIGLFSCKSDKPSIIPQSIYTPSSTDSLVWIACEGNYNWGNASVSVYNKYSNVIQNDIFQSVNHRNLGDVCQSITQIKEKLYIVVNNSGKIEVVDAKTFQSIQTITGFVSPRYLLPISESKAYVSDIYANKISVIDLNEGKIIQSIPVKGWTEKMILKNQKVYVTNYYSDKLFIIDISKDQIIDSVKISKSASSLQLDKNNKLWILCSGDESLTTNATIYRLDLSSLKIEQEYKFQNTEHISQLEINSSLDTLYYINNGVYKMSINETKLPEKKLIEKPIGSTFYGMGIDKKTNQLYITDAKDYQQKGNLYIYSTTGILIHSLKTGVIPGQICFGN